MSLDIALSTASSALRTVEAQVSVAADNVNNADRAGYTRKVQQVETVGTDTGASLRAGEIDRIVNAFLADAVIAETSTLGKSRVTADYLDQLAGALGDTASGANLTATLGELESSLQTLGVSADSHAAEADVLTNAQASVDALNAQSGAVQELRRQADQDIAGTVDEINASLERLDDLNQQIADLQTKGLPAAELEDQRDAELEALAANIGVQSFYTDDNRLQIYTDGGEPLLNSSAHTLSFSTSGKVTGETSYPGQLSGVTVNGKDITGSIDGGRLGGLIELRDETLVEEQDKLDTLAGALIDDINAAHNRGAAHPPPNSLSGTAGFAAADAVAASGSVRLAVADADGKVQAVADIDLSALTTVQDVADALDAVPGVTAGLGADGALFVQADDPALGIALNELDGAVGPDGRGLSHYFGLNDLLAGTGAEDIRLSAAIDGAPERVAAGALSDDPALAAGDWGVTAGDGSTAEAMAGVFRTSQSFAATGDLSAQNATLADYADTVVASTARRAEHAVGDLDAAQYAFDYVKEKLTNETGVNIDQELATLTSLENSYEAIASVMQVIQEMFDTLLSTVD